MADCGWSARGMLHYLRESERLYDEAYGLSFARLLEQGHPRRPAKYDSRRADAGIDRCVKSFIDSILDLIRRTPRPVTSSWTASAAASWSISAPTRTSPRSTSAGWVDGPIRQYPVPNAFLGSKPGPASTTKPTE